jgi:glycyl-radical enzyme activating protein
MVQPAALNIFDIQHFSWHDGPGIRTVVFLKGCNLRCFWCHNPESQDAGAELFYHEERCIRCGKCVKVCPTGCHSITEQDEHRFDRTHCVCCGKCAEVCYSEALQVSGEIVAIDDVMAEIVKDVEFYEISGGGVTLSGGEPLIQPEGCRELFGRLRKLDGNINTAIDTAGNVPWSAFEMVLPVTDYLLFDIKTLNDDIHRKATGVSNRLILENLGKLRRRDVRLIIRIAIIPGINDSPSELDSIATELRDFDNIYKIELLPFHAIGKTKYHALDRAYQAEELSLPDPDLIEKLKADMQL